MIDNASSHQLIEVEERFDLPDDNISFIIGLINGYENFGAPMKLIQFGLDDVDGGTIVLPSDDPEAGQPAYNLDIRNLGTTSAALRVRDNADNILLKILGATTYIGNATTVDDTLTVSGDSEFWSNLYVAGLTTLDNDTTINGDLDLNGNAAVSGDVTLETASNIVFANEIADKIRLSGTALAGYGLGVNTSELTLYTAGAINTPGAAGLAVRSNTVGGAGYAIWHAGNDGSGSGLDADKLDNVDSGDFLQSTTTLSGGQSKSYKINGVNAITFASDGGGVIFSDTGGGASCQMTAFAGSGFTVYCGAGNQLRFLTGTGSEFFRAKSTESQPYFNGYKLWHEGNDGAGSGLDADYLDSKTTGTGIGDIAFYDSNNRVYDSDRLDGNHASAFLLDSGDSANGNYTFAAVSGTPASPDSFTLTNMNLTVNTSTGVTVFKAETDNVGIGTASPDNTYILDVQGAVRVNGTARITGATTFVSTIQCDDYVHFSDDVDFNFGSTAGFSRSTWDGYLLLMHDGVQVEVPYKTH